MTHPQTRNLLINTPREHLIEMVLVRNKIIQRLQKELQQSQQQ